MQEKINLVSQEEPLNSLIMISHSLVVVFI